MKSFEWSLKGYIRNDPRISHFLRLRTLVASGIFWILFFAVEKEYLVRRDSRQKPSADAARDDGAKRAFEFLYRVKTCASAYRPPWLFSHSIPCWMTYFLPTAAKSKQKVPLEGNTLHPIIRQILLVVCTCSRQWQTQSPSMAIALQNSPDNWRALSRG